MAPYPTPTIGRLVICFAIEIKSSQVPFSNRATMPKLILSHFLIALAPLAVAGCDRLMRKERERDRKEHRRAES